MNLNHRLPRIVVKPDLLSEDFLPSTFHARHRQLQELKACLAPALRGQKPIHVWLHGPPGTGKTSVARQVLEQMNDSRIKGAIINCNQNNTCFGVLDQLIEDLGILYAEERRTGFKFKAVRKHIKDKPLVIVLDKIDQMPLKERSFALEELSTLGNVGLVCVGTKKLEACAASKDADSRLNLQLIGFPKYSESDLIEILNDRVRYSLREDSWCVRSLEKIACLANGDARIALQTLKSAAHIAESDYSHFIEQCHIDRGFSSTRHLRKYYVLSMMTEHHQLMYAIIKKKGKILSRDLRKEYKAECRIRDWEPVALRTFSEYCRQLVLNRLIDGKRARVKGKVFEFQVSA